MTMPVPLRVLVLAHDASQVDALTRELDRHGLQVEIRCVENPHGLDAALAGDAPHVVVARPDRPTVREAFEHLRATYPHVPAIFVDPLPIPAPSHGIDVVVADSLAAACGTLAEAIPRLARRGEALREATLRVRAYRRLFENACDAILVVDLSTDRIIDANPMAVEMLGYPRETLLGRPAADLGDASWRNALEHLPLAQDRWRGDVVLATARGEPLVADASARLYEAGGARVAQWHLRDVTELRRIERQVRVQERLLQRIIDCSPDRIALLDCDGAVEWVSSGALHGDAIAAASDWTALWSPADHLAARSALEAARRGATGHFSAFSNDGLRWFDVLVAGVPDEDGGRPQILAVSRDLTALRLAQERLREREAHLRSILQSAPDAIVTTDADGVVTEFNPAAETLFGHARAEVIGRSFAILLFSPDLAHALDARRERYLATREPRLLGRPQRIDALHASGTAVPTEVTLERLGTAEPPAFAAFIRDCRAEALLEEASARHARRLVQLAEFGHRALRVRELDRLVGLALQAACDGLGVRHACLLQVDAAGRAAHVRAQRGWPELPPGAPACVAPGGLRLREALLARDARHTDEALAARTLGRGQLRSALEVPVAGARQQFGVLGVYSEQEQAFADDAMDFMHGLANLLESAVERLHAEDAAAYLAQFDALTGLANRGLLRDRIAQALAHAARKGGMLGVMIIGLDRLKHVNDHYGLAAGDAVLRQVATRLQQVMGPIDALGRLGGDEFALAWNEFDTAEDAGDMAARVAEVFAAPCRFGDVELWITASRGAAVYPVDGHDVDTLLANADIALQRAKQEGGKAQVFFGHECNLRVRQRLQIEHELREALAREELALVFQPQVRIDDGRTVGAEALLRWRHPSRGLLAPGQFLEVAEQTGLIADIGRWVLHAACEAAMRWHRLGYDGVSVAVNVSPTQMRHDDLVSHIRDAVARSGLPVGCLEVELTENLAMDGDAAFLATLTRLRSEGIRIAIDDFGTGYSSLSYLKRFPIDRLKIDRAFIADIDHSTADEPVSRAIIALSHQLGFEVVAEGVENAHQAAFLRRHGCDVAQGFLIARPMSGRAFAGWLRRGGVARR